MDLDDFFAKKDKKKGKSKKSFVSSELKHLEQPVVKEKEQNKNVEESNNETANDDNDEEWGEFTESKRPDYSNLKLGQLTIEEEQQNQRDAGNDNNDGDNTAYNDDNSENPWKKAGAQAETTTVNTTASNSSKTGVYVAPRGDSAKAKKKNAPDLNNQNYFPSLGSEKPIEPLKMKKDGFEEVKHGVKKGAQTSMTSNPVSIGNTYSSLFNNNDIES